MICSQNSGTGGDNNEREELRHVLVRAHKDESEPVIEGVANYGNNSTNVKAVETSRMMTENCFSFEFGDEHRSPVVVMMPIAHVTSTSLPSMKLSYKADAETPSNLLKRRP